MWKRLDPNLPNKIKNKIENNRKKRKNGRRKTEIHYMPVPRSRTTRKDNKRYIKEIRARNKKLITKYPWLATRDWKTGLPEDNRYRYISLWDEIPEGWIRAFGEQMCDEIEAALEEDNIQNDVYVEQAKEKYGQLRIYMSGNTKSLNIIDIYSRISENVCCNCGRPHVPMMNFSWISPYCKNCFLKLQKKHEGFYKGEYEKYAPEDKSEWRIPNELKWTRFSKDGNETITVDISNYVKAIEQRWNERNPDDPV